MSTTTLRAGGASGPAERGARVAVLLEVGDMAGVAAEIDAFAAALDDDGQPHLAWFVPLWRGSLALLQGRYDECERQNRAAAAMGVAAGSRRSETQCRLQLLALRRAQDRLMEVEAPTRALARGAAGLPSVRASLARVLAHLGRDGEARAELRRLAADGFTAVASGPGGLAALDALADAAALAGLEEEAALLYEHLLPHAGRFAVEGAGAAWGGSLSRPLGLLAHTVGRWDAADAHFADAMVADRGVGAPLFVAHTGRQWSALLRARGGDGDWERALQLLAEAEHVYRRLDVERPAEEARAVLARSHEPAHADRSGEVNVLRRHGEGWVVRYGTSTAAVPDSRGMAYLARLLARPGCSFHAVDLVLGNVAGAVGRASQPPPVPSPLPAASRLPVIDADVRAEYQARLAQLEVELASATAAGDRLGVSLRLVERDRIAADLEMPADPAVDAVEGARRAAGLRILLALDQVGAVHPALGRHLRQSVRTGTFCSYEPAFASTWAVSDADPGTTVGRG